MGLWHLSEKLEGPTEALQRDSALEDDLQSVPYLQNHCKKGRTHVKMLWREMG